MPLRCRRTSQLPLKRSVSLEHQWDYSSTPEDRRHYCIQVTVTPEDGGGDQPPLTHAWGRCLINDILQEAWPEDWITEAVVLSPGKAILFFGRWSRNEGLPYHRARNDQFGLGGPFNWPGRPAQIEALRKTVQEGCHAIIEAVVEKKTKTRRPGQPWGKAKQPRTPIVAYDIKEWIWGLEWVSDGEPKWNDKMNHGTGQQRIHSQWGSQGWRRNRCQRAPQLPREHSGGSSSLGGNSSDGQSKQSLWQSNQVKVADQRRQEEALG